MKPKLLKSRFISPYNGTASNLAFARNKPGVYLIAIRGEIRYIGYSESNVEKTCLRHFQSWDDSKQTRVTYRSRTDVTVRVILTTAARAKELEKALIIKLRPIDNPDKLNGYLGKVPKSAEQILEEYENAGCSPAAVMEDAPF